MRRAEQVGGRLVERGEHAPGLPYAFIADPDGYVIEISGPGVGGPHATARTVTARRATGRERR